MGFNTSKILTVMKTLESCIRCPRIQKNFDILNNIYPDYINKPIQPIGSLSSTICIVGLAPGLHGANRTGITFNGDFSGDILNQCLKLNNMITNQTHNKGTMVHITNAVKCFPPKNKPLKNEINNCLSHLSKEFLSMKNLKIIVVLGRLAHNSVLKSYNIPLTKFKFVHGFCHKLKSKLIMIDSYHCSKININTKKLTVKMLSMIFILAKKLSKKYD